MASAPQAAEGSLMALLNKRPGQSAQEALIQRLMKGNTGESQELIQALLSSEDPGSIRLGEALTLFNLCFPTGCSTRRNICTMVCARLWAHPHACISERFKGHGIAYLLARLRDEPGQLHQLPV